MSQRYQSTLEGQRDYQRPDNAWRTVSYYSEPMGRALGFVIIYAPLAVLLLALSVGIVWYARVDFMWVLIVFGILGTAGYFLLVPFHYRYSQEGIDRTQIEATRDVELARVDGVTTVQVAESSARQAQFVAERYRLQSAQGRIDNAPAQSDLNRVATWVPAHTTPQAEDAMVQEVIRWCGRAHDAMTGDGRCTSTVPWAKSGTLGPTDAERAQRWLQLAGNASGHWIVRYDVPRRGWYVNVQQFRNGAELLDALSSVSAPK